MCRLAALPRTRRSPARGPRRNAVARPSACPSSNGGRGQRLARHASGAPALAGETADLLYHALVVLAERDLAPAEVIAVLRDRAG